MGSFKVPQRLMIAFSAIVAFSGCGDSSHSGDVIYVEDEQQVGISWEDYRRQAKISIGGKVVYVVEGDLFFATEAGLRDYYEEMIVNDGWKLAVFKRISDGLEPVYSLSEALDITYCVSNLFQSSFQPFDKSRVISEAATAMRDWERVANVRFRYISTQDATCTETNANVDFAIIPISMFGGCALNKKMWGGPNSWCPNTAGAQVTSGGMLGMNYGAIGVKQKWSLSEVVARAPGGQICHARLGSNSSLHPGIRSPVATATATATRSVSEWAGCDAGHLRAHANETPATRQTFDTARSLLYRRAPALAAATMI